MLVEPMHLPSSLSAIMGLVNKLIVENCLKDWTHSNYSFILDKGDFIIHSYKCLRMDHSCDFDSLHNVLIQVKKTQIDLILNIAYSNKAFYINPKLQEEF